jgi:hypothetical protein
MYRVQRVKGSDRDRRALRARGGCGGCGGCVVRRVRAERGADEGGVGCLFRTCFAFISSFSSCFSSTTLLPAALLPDIGMQVGGKGSCV